MFINAVDTVGAIGGVDAVGAADVGGNGHEWL